MNNTGSLYPILETLFKALSGDLADGYFKRLVLTEADILPELRHGIVECREKPYSDQVDLMVCVFKEEADKLRAFLCQHQDQYSNWAPVIEFLIDWTDPNGFLSQTLENIYLVFDNEKGRDPYAVPWIYLAFRKFRLSREVWLALFSKAANHIPGHFSTKTQNMLSFCLSEIQEPYWIFGYGILHARGRNSVRLGICGFRSINQIRDYLKRIYWTGNGESLEDLCAFMDAFAESYVLALDIGERPQKRIGIECVISKRDNVHHLAQALEALSKRNLYDTSRAKALTESVREADINSTKTRLESWVNHIKLVFTEESTLEVKTYIYYNILKQQ